MSVEEIFKANGYNCNAKQFMQFFSALDQNSRGELNYKQLLELVLGEEDALKFFSGGGFTGTSRMRPQAQIQFVMPIQPTGAKTAIMGEIGKKFIQAGKNYEEEFKIRIGEKQASSQVPRATDQEMLSVMTACGVRLTEDERVTLQGYIASQKDSTGSFPLMELLAAIGLPPQTLGFRG